MLKLFLPRLHLVGKYRGCSSLSSGKGRVGDDVYERKFYKEWDDLDERKYRKDLDDLVGKYRRELNDFGRLKFFMNFRNSVCPAILQTRLIKFIDNLPARLEPLFSPEMSTRSLSSRSLISELMFSRLVGEIVPSWAERFEHTSLLRRSIQLEFEKDCLLLFPSFIKLPYDEFLDKKAHYFFGTNIVEIHSEAMAVEKPTRECFNDIGGLEKQVEAIVEIEPTKSVLLYGPPDAGKTLTARAYAAEINANFLKLAGPQLVKMFIVDGVNPVSHAFQLATKKSPCVIFIDDIDAIGTKQFDSEVRGCRLLRRIMMLELLSQLDDAMGDHDVKVIAATERPDILDPALMWFGRLDSQIEFSYPTEEARAAFRSHSRKMNVHPDVNFGELARSTDNFNGAQLKNVRLLAELLANGWPHLADLGHETREIIHGDFDQAIFGIRVLKKRQAMKP